MLTYIYIYICFPNFAPDIIIVDSFCFLGSFQLFSSDVGETTVSHSLLTSTIVDGLGCEEEVIDTKACS